MRDLLLACIVFGALPFVLKRPFYGILLMAWLGYMNPHKLCYGFMLSFPVVYTVALTTFTGMLISKEAKRIVWSREIVVLVIFVVWMGITTTQAMYFDLAREQYIKVIKIQILTFMTLLMLTSRDKVHLFVWVLVLSLGFYGFKGGLFTIAHGGSYRVQGPETTFIGGNNELALALVMTIPLMRYLQLHERRHWIKLGLIALMLLTAIAAIGSQSRGALVALSLTGGIFWLKGRNKVVNAIFIVMVIGAVAAIMPAEWYARMNTIQTYDQDASALGRINAWWVAWNVARTHFFGGGFEMFQYPTFQMYAPEPNNLHDVHSIYFQMMGHHGFIGLALFLTLLGMTWRTCTQIGRMTKKVPELSWARDLAAMLQVSLIAYMTGGAFLGLGYFDYLYHLVALAVVVRYLVGESVSPKPAEQVQPPPLARPRPLPRPARSAR